MANTKKDNAVKNEIDVEALLNKDFQPKSLQEALEYINHLKRVVKIFEYKQGGRKKQVKELLKQPLSIEEIASKLGITNKNVSSILCALKKEGNKIATNSQGKKFFEK